jgi:hypothetical protein
MRARIEAPRFGERPELTSPQSPRASGLDAAKPEAAKGLGL